jgi:hypothetical protein
VQWPWIKLKTLVRPASSIFYFDLCWYAWPLMMVRFLPCECVVGHGSDEEDRHGCDELLDENLLSLR